jgi:hypothetical protein
MSEQKPADDDVSVFGVVKAATEAIAHGVGAAEDDAAVIGTVIGAWATMVTAALRP